MGNTSLRKQQKALEDRSHELANRMRNRREGLQVQQSADLLENLQLAADRDFQVGSLHREIEELAAVQKALDRVKGGSYSLCAECEEPISPLRLQALPWALRCVTCQEAHERAHPNHSSPEPDVLLGGLEANVA